MDSMLGYHNEKYEYFGKVAARLDDVANFIPSRISAIYMIIAFISYISTGAADQTMIESPKDGELMDTSITFSNTCGKLGAYMSWYFIKRCFGLTSFLIPVFLILLGVHLIKAYRVNLLKWFMSMMIVMIWGSVTFAKFLSPLFIERVGFG